MKIEIKKVKLSDIRLNPDNPRRIFDEDMDYLIKSLREFPDMMQLREIVVDETMMVLGGNMRLLALYKIGAKECTAKIVKGLTVKQKREFVIKDNSTFGQWDFDKLANEWSDLPLREYGINLPEDWLNELDKLEEKEKPTRIDPLQADDVILKKIEESDKIIFQFSGGRDSSLAILKILPLLEGKDYEAVYVDTGVEIPDTIYHIHKFLDIYNVPLKILHGKNFFEVYYPKKIFPDAIFRDCIDILINKPCDDYIKSLEGNILLIRGGRNTQKTSQSNTDIFQEIDKGKLKLRLLNPLFYVPEDQYNEEREKIMVWPGYAKGFNRTACWCCPFQQLQQWEALKEYYPVLWEVMKELATTWKFKNHPGDGNIKRFKKYWGSQR